MNKKTEKFINTLNNNDLKVLRIYDKYIDYEDMYGYKYKKYIDNRIITYDRKRLTERKYDIRNPYCIDNINITLQQNNPYNTTIKEYNGSHKKATFICGKCGKEFSGLIGNVLKYKYKICWDCVRTTQKTKLKDTEEIRMEVESYGYKLLSEKWVGDHTRIDIMDKDGYKGKTKIEALRSSGSFDKFSTYNPYSLENLQLCCKLNGFEYSIPNQIYEYHTKVKVKCDYCNNIFIGKTYDIVSNNVKCPICYKTISRLELKTEQYLKEHNIKYIKQYKYSDCKYKKPMPFDFYLVDYNILIECQGEQHYKPISVFGGEKGFKLQQKRDNIKRNYCKKHNIHLIELPYWDFNNKDNYIKTLDNELKA